MEVQSQTEEGKQENKVQSQTKEGKHEGEVQSQTEIIRDQDEKGHGRKEGRQHKRKQTNTLLHDFIHPMSLKRINKPNYY